MGVYIGATPISKVYQGSSVLSKLNLGGNLLWVNQAASPTITYVSRGETSLTFTLTNNDTSTASIYYEHTDTTPDLSFVSLASGASTNVTVTGLASSTSYTVYAQAVVTGKESSTIVNFTQSTAGWTQLGSEYSKASGSPHFTTIDGRTWWAPVFNNSSIASTQWKFVATSTGGEYSNEYWQELYIAAHNGTTYNSTAASGLSFSGFITSYINNPSRAFDGNYALPSGTAAASVSSGNHNGSTIFLNFASPVTLNTIRIQTGYTKVSGMTLYYM